MSIAQLTQPTTIRNTHGKLPCGWAIRAAAGKEGTIFYKVFQDGRYRQSFPTQASAETFAEQAGARRSTRQEVE